MYVELIYFSDKRLGKKSTDSLVGVINKEDMAISFLSICKLKQKKTPYAINLFIEIRLANRPRYLLSFWCTSATLENLF